MGARRSALDEIRREVLRGGLAGVKVGRFEVTRAQYAAFDESYEIPEGTENWPASGITFEQAMDYCMWLSETTGRKYRLPKESEMEKLISAAASNASEWTITDDGKGKVPGFSVLSPTDKRCEYSPPPPGYVGFRVIEEKS